MQRLNTGFVPDFRVTFTSSGLNCLLENYFASGGEGKTVGITVTQINYRNGWQAVNSFLQS
jgi:hypothetical protein